MELRGRNRSPFSGFTSGEVQKMELLLQKNGEQFVHPDVCKKLARAFNTSNGRLGKPLVKWTEVHNWFQNREPNGAEERAVNAQDRKPETEQLFRAVKEACSTKRGGRGKGKNAPKLLKWEFEAKSAKDNAWYDVDKFVGNRLLDSDSLDAEVLVRFDGFEKDEDEWVKVSNAVRQRSIPLEPCECHLVKVGKTALYYKEKKTDAKYFEVQISSINRKVHDVRGCRCIFTVRYIGRNIKEKVQLKSLYFRPSILEL